MIKKANLNILIFLEYGLYALDYFEEEFLIRIKAKLIYIVYINLFVPYRLGYFIESFYPNKGGAETRAFKILSKLKNFDVNVYTINFGYENEEKINNINIQRILNAEKEKYFKNGGRNLLISFSFASKVREIIKNEDFDIYIFDQFPYFHFISSEKFLKDKVKIVQVHEILKGYYKNFIKNIALEHYERRMFSGSDMNIVTNNINKELLINGYNIPEDKIKVIPNGIDIVEGKKNGDGILFVGRNTKDKNIKAILDVARKLKDIQFTLVTEIDGIDIPNVRIKCGLDENELYNEYRKSRIFITASIREGFSIASLEAMGFGNPVVYLKNKFNIPMQDIVKDGVTAYGCSSIEEMVEKIRYIYENQGEWEKMSRNAIDIAKNYTWEKVAGDYEKFLLSLIGGKN